MDTLKTLTDTEYMDTVIDLLCTARNGTQPFKTAYQIVHSIVYLRNVCAHHTRLWNRNMSISPQAPKTTTNTWITDKNVRTNKTYFMLCMIRYLLQTVNPNTTFSDRLKQLFAKYPNVDAKAMDFPINWEREPLWL